MSKTHARRQQGTLGNYTCAPCRTSCGVNQTSTGTCTLGGYSDYGCVDCLTSCPAGQVLMGRCTFTTAPRCQHHYEIDATPAAIKNAPSSFYGNACAASKDYFACSATGYGTGAVVIYKMDVDNQRVSLLQIISPSTPLDTSRFGASLDMDGDLLVVGAPGYAISLSSSYANTGRVWVFKRNANNRYTSLGELSAPSQAASKVFRLPLY